MDIFFVVPWSSPSGRVDGDGVRFSRYVGDETGAVGPLQLSHVDGVAQLGPVGRVVAEPVHPRVVRPVDVARDPVGRDVPGTPEVGALMSETGEQKSARPPCRGCLYFQRCPVFCA